MVTSMPTMNRLRQQIASTRYRRAELRSVTDGSAISHSSVVYVQLLYIYNLWIGERRLGGGYDQLITTPDRERTAA
jgi:hypothetical protein